MTAFIVVIHVIISLLLILVILLQQGKGADLAGAFGGGGSQTAFGARGATTLLQKLTSGLFVAFILTSLTLAVVQSQPRTSVMRSGTAASEAPALPPADSTAPAPATQPAPATPAPAQQEPATQTTPAAPTQ